jgi:glycosyltransferase involved in cell wall biosynthesis
MRDVQTLARSLGIAPQVHFVGIRRDIPVLIRSARALILPSDREGLPRSVMEAMALGVPVIGSDIRGTRELLAGGAGYMYPLGDIDQLTDAMRRVLARPSEVARTVTLARQRVEMFGLQGLLAMHEQLYERAMREKRCACNRTNRTGMSRVM